MQKRYRALRIIATIYKLLGVIIGILTILAILGFCVSAVTGAAVMQNLGQRGNVFPAVGNVGLALVGSVIGIIYGGGLSLTLYALGEFIYLLLAIEENTRATVLLLEQKR